MSQVNRPKPTGARKITLKRQTLKDLTPTRTAAERIKGGYSVTETQGVTKRCVAEGDSRYCPAAC